jgi:hypothetical protein
MSASKDDQLKALTSQASPGVRQATELYLRVQKTIEKSASPTPVTSNSANA